MKIKFVGRLGGLIWVLSIYSFLQCGTPTEATTSLAVSQPGKRPKNIILMIGDGMGLSQVSAALYANNNTLNLERFPVIGFHKSYSASDLVTDSAAGATAFSCGEKTYNGAVGLKKDTTPCPTILEEAEARGMATGIVVTSTIVHATPAAFVAHQPMRTMYEEIAADLVKTEVDFLIGGGLRYFNRRKNDNRDLVKELQRKNYVVTTFLDNTLNASSMRYDKNFIYFAADSDPLPVMHGRNYLPYATRMAMTFLQKHNEDKGFFLLVEGSQIDWANHAHEGNMAISEILDFDQTIKNVLAFAQANGETLVIVTADHETGGMALNEGSKMKRPKLAFTTNGHTASLVPVYAYGPGSELFHGLYENTAIYQKMRQALGFGDGNWVSESTGFLH